MIAYYRSPDGEVHMIETYPHMRYAVIVSSEVHMQASDYATAERRRKVIARQHRTATVRMLYATRAEAEASR